MGLPQRFRLISHVVSEGQASASLEESFTFPNINHPLCVVEKLNGTVSVTWGPKWKIGNVYGPSTAICPVSVSLLISGHRSKSRNYFVDVENKSVQTWQVKTVNWLNPAES